MDLRGPSAVWWKDVQCSFPAGMRPGPSDGLGGPGMAPQKPQGLLSQGPAWHQQDGHGGLGSWDVPRSPSPRLGGAQTPDGLAAALLDPHSPWGAPGSEGLGPLHPLTGLLVPHHVYRGRLSRLLPAEPWGSLAGAGG